MKKIITIRTIAKICHDANKSFCASIGDNSQPDWDHAPEWQKKSALNGVKFHLDNPDSKPSDSHNNWLKEKKQEGWKYGKEKNVALKIHPCFVPYSKLPKQQQAKDYLFSSIIHALRPFLK